MTMSAGAGWTSAGMYHTPTAEPVAIVERLERPELPLKWEQTSYTNYPAAHLAARQETASPHIIEKHVPNILGYMLQLINLLDENNFDKECLLPSERALKITVSLLEAAQEHGVLLADGLLYPDGNGGLRMEWRKEERYALLSVHQNDESQDYIYLQQGAERGDLDTGVTPNQLIESLRGLID